MNKNNINNSNMACIWQALADLDYVWLNPVGYSHPLIYLPKEQLKKAYEAFDSNQQILVKRPGGLGTSLKITCGGSSFIIRFMHVIQSHGLILIPSKEIKAGVRVNEQGIKVLSELHHFEFHVIRDFIHGHGMKRTTFEYFKDLHPMTQSDLLDSFNEKYGSNFRRIAEFVNFDSRQQEKMTSSLRSKPWNKSFNRLANNLRPLYFRLARQVGIF